MTAAKLAAKLQSANLKYTTSIIYDVLSFSTSSRICGDYPVFFYHTANHATAYAPINKGEYKICTVAEGIRHAKLFCQKND